MSTNRKIKIWETAGETETADSHREYDFTPDDLEENNVVNLYTQVTYQTLEGFGGAITDSAGYVFSLMSESQKQEMLTAYFSREDMSYRLVRLHMDSCDFSTEMYQAVSDPADENFDTFDFTHTEKYILPLLDRAQETAGQKLPLMLSVWSPPAFMKSNGQRREGGKLLPGYYKRYAAYICRYMQEFISRGYQVERISVQNEPNAVQKWDSCVYTSEEEKTFLKEALYPAMKEKGLSDIEIFIWDHNKERLYERVRDIVDEETKEMVQGAAFHWYSGDHFEALDLVREQYPQMKLILSESCLEYSKFDESMEGINAFRLAHDMMGNLNHGLHAFYDWNILLDEKGGPNHVGNFCDAPFLYDREGQRLIPRRTLMCYRHFGRFIRPGAVRIGHTCYTGDLEVTSWRNPDGRIAVVFLNQTREKKDVLLRMEGQQTRITLAPFSISSGVIE
jgi:glucosylceramidase